MSERASLLQPVRRNNVVDEIVARFKQALIDGEFLPGQKRQSEAELAGGPGVGRSTGRKVRKILSAGRGGDQTGRRHLRQRRRG